MKKKNKRARGVRTRKTADAAKTRELAIREDGQVYARVTDLNGDCRLTARCDDGQERQCRIRGTMRRRQWVRKGDTLLVSLRSFDDNIADVIHLYNASEVASLELMGEIRPGALGGGGDQDDDTADAVRFAEDDGDIDAI